MSECCRLRIKDIDFDNGALLVREAKGDKDRSTLLPQYIQPRLREHLKRVRGLFEEDRKAQVAGVYLPGALDRKLPKAGIEWAWQWVFPSRTLSLDRDQDPADSTAESARSSQFGARAERPGRVKVYGAVPARLFQVN